MTAKRHETPEDGAKRETPEMTPDGFPRKWQRIGDLLPYPNNAKTHPEEQIAKLAGLFLEHGFDVPIVVDASNVIIKGHGRRLACLKLQEQGTLVKVPGLQRSADGEALVPTIVRDDLSEAQVRAARLADNRIAETAWDAGFLRLELEQLQEFGVSGLDLGFGKFELAVLFDSIEHPQADDSGTDEQYRDKKEILVTVHKYENGTEAFDAIRELCDMNPHWDAKVSSHGAAE